MRAQVKQIEAPVLVDVRGNPLSKGASYDAGDRLTRELATWTPRSVSGDAAVLPGRERLSSRASDISRNNGYAQSGVQLHVDAIVGNHFKLSYKPNCRVLGLDPESEAVTDFIQDVEAAFTDYAENPECLIDAEGKRTFTMLVRAGVHCHVRTGEIFSSAEWIRRSGLRTAIKVVHPDRISNPNGLRDSARLRGGIDLGHYGEAIGYHLRTAHASDAGFGVNTHKWRFIRKQTRWGRAQMIHVFDPTEDGQSRGNSGFASVLKRLKMLDKYQDVVLQNAVVNAMYAMVIESEFDQATALEAIGASAAGDDSSLLGLLGAINAYYEGANVTFDGVKIPHLFPGEKLNMQTAKSPIGVEHYEQQLLRYVAAGLNVSYEQLSKDYSNTNYSSARAAMLETWRYFSGQRSVIAKRYASMIFALVLEEMIDRRVVVLPAGAPSFYDAKSAWCNCDWIAAGMTHIDGLKEAKRLVLLLEAGLITEETAHAELGQDYQAVFDQLMREQRDREKRGMPPPLWRQEAKMSTSAAYQEAPAVNTNAQSS